MSELRLYQIAIFRLGKQEFILCVIFKAAHDKVCEVENLLFKHTLASFSSSWSFPKRNKNNSHSFRYIKVRKLLSRSPNIANIYWILHNIFHDVSLNSDWNSRATCFVKSFADSLFSRQQINLLNEDLMM